MANERASVIGLLILEFLAVILYPPAFFTQAPQAIVLPPTLVLLLVVALILVNTGHLSLEAGRNSLNFVQGVNIVVRIMMFLPNLRTGDTWNWAFMLAEVLGIGLSWYTITRLDKLPPNALLLRHKPEV